MANPNVPLDLVRKHFGELIPNQDTKDIFIEGTVVKKWPLQQRSKNSYHLKCLISEENTPSTKKLPVFLLNNFAKEAETISVGDDLALTGFTVEKQSNSKPDLYDVLVSIDSDDAADTDNGNLPKLWMRQIDNDDIEEDEDGEAVREVNRMTQYDYVTLKTIEDNGSASRDAKYNVYGLVLECNMRMAKGSPKPYLEVVLADQTLSGMKVWIFGKLGDVFPEVHPFDIVRLHRMKVESNRLPVEGRCFSPKDVMVFDGKSENFEFRSTAARFTLEAIDQEKFLELRRWAKTLPNVLKTVSELQPDQYADIICQVIHVSFRHDGQKEYAVLTVWDGTKPPNYLARHELFTDAEMSHIVTDKMKDCVFHVWVFDFHLAAARNLQPYDIVELKNIHVYVPQDGVEPDFGTPGPKLCLHLGNSNNRGIHPLPEERKGIFKEKLVNILREDAAIADNSDRHAVSIEEDRMEDEDPLPGVNNSTINEALLNTSMSLFDHVNENGNDSFHTAMEAENGLEVAEPLKITSSDSPASTRSYHTIQDSPPLPNNIVNLQNHTESQNEPVVENDQLNVDVNDVEQLPSADENLQNDNIVTEVFGDVPENYTSLKEISDNTEERIFRVLAIILKMKQEPIFEDIVNLKCAVCKFVCSWRKLDRNYLFRSERFPSLECPMCQKRKEARYLQPFLKLQFLLCDSEAVLKVLLLKDSAMEFFGDISFDRLWQSRFDSNTYAKEQINQIYAAKQTIKMGGSLDSVVPCLDCCVTSRRVQDKVFHYITNTRIKKERAVMH